MAGPLKAACNSAQIVLEMSDGQKRDKKDLCGEQETLGHG